MAFHKNQILIYFQKNNLSINILKVVDFYIQNETVRITFFAKLAYLESSS